MNYDTKYFENRGLEQKHFAQSMQFLKYLNDEGALHEETKFYDYGCGRGPYVYAIKYYGFNINGYDISSDAIANPVQGVGELISGTLSNDEFNVVLCLDVAEHVGREAEEEVINNLWKLVKNEGYLIMSICDITLKDKYVDESHVNLRSREYWINQFVRKGFTYCDVPDYWYFREQMYIFKKEVRE